MDPDALIDDLHALVREARGLPLSASCVLNRAAALERIDALRAALPTELRDARQVLAEADDLVAAARDRAEEVLAHAADEREQRLALAPQAAEASAWADAVRAEAEAAANTRAQEADDYVEAKLANFEVVLEKSLEVARRGGEEDPRQAADELEVRLAGIAEAFERTLVSVRRGRDRLSGRHHMEELGDHLRAMEDDADGDPPSQP